MQKNRNQTLNILIVNTQPIPSFGAGAASVNRILSYTKGLIKEGQNVRILSTGVGKDQCWHDYEGVPVKHLGRKSASSIIKILNYLLVAFHLICSLTKIKKDVVLFATSNYPLILLLEVYCKISRTKIVNERGEFPFVLMNKTKFNKYFAPIYVNTAYKLLDGMIVMTNPLLEFFQPKASKKCKFLLVPMTVDVNRFLESESLIDNPYGNYIAYCGNMGGSKDGVPNLLKSFSIVEKRGYDLSLLLIGGTNRQQQLDSLVELNNKLGNRRVFFFGRAEREKMPSLLKGAKILALARPSGLRSTGGFPTKLGEYLSTGNPVLVTSVGDIPQFLKDRENAYVVPPDNIETFADAICYIWDHYSEAQQIGLKGQELAKTVFNGDFQAKRIVDFLNEMVN